MQQSIETLLFRTWPGLKSRLRIALFKSLGMSVGAQCRFERVRARRLSQIRVGKGNALSEGCWLWPVDDAYAGTRIQIGEDNYFNRDCMIDACGSVRIGNRNMFGPGVYITDSNHTVSCSDWVAHAPMQVGRVEIGNGCWIGARAVLLKDVVLGDRCVVAAGAVVTKSFPQLSLIAGVPARLVRVLADG
jgi:acetyltransferase-like isoleucine patch superfamily enzyme